MLFFFLTFLGGILTIFSPCVLPVVPFVFSRSDQPFRKSGLPLLVGMALSFSLFGLLSVTGGNWVVQANQYGRTIAILIFSLLGLTLLFPKLGDRLMAPFVRLGGALQKKAEAGSGLFSSLLLGASIGLLWAPCAGPILGLVLAGAAVSGAHTETFGLLLCFALGAATSLAVVILAGGKLLRTLKKGLGAEEWIKRGIGVVVLVAVVGIAFGLDTKVLSKISYFNTNKIEESLVQGLSPSEKSVNETLPALEGATEWLNSKPLTREALKGKVVLIDFWTYSCINCLRSLPYVKAWNEKYKDQGLVVIGVHAPEFAFEKDRENVMKAVHDLGIDYPVAIDNDSKIWDAFHNQYWPAHYFADGNGKIRYHHFGEGGYEESEKVIQALLMENQASRLGSKSPVSQPILPVEGSGVGAKASAEKNKSPETYLGYSRAKGFSSTPEILEDEDQKYEKSASLSLHHWAVSGIWKFEEERALLRKKGGTLAYRFQGRDLHLVLGNSGTHPIAFRVTLNGKPPGASHGLDVDENGKGMISGHRLYQLIRKEDNQAESVFEIEFLDSGAEAYAFTFG